VNYRKFKQFGSEVLEPNQFLLRFMVWNWRWASMSMMAGSVIARSHAASGLPFEPPRLEWYSDYR
jgi:hypothetical protein